MLFFTGLRRKPHKDKQNSGYYYEERDLPHTINPLEANLGEKETRFILVTHLLCLFIL